MLNFDDNKFEAELAETGEVTCVFEFVKFADIVEFAEFALKEGLVEFAEDDDDDEFSVEVAILMILLRKNKKFKN